MLGIRPTSAALCRRHHRRRRWRPRTSFQEALVKLVATGASEKLAIAASSASRAAVEAEFSCCTTGILNLSDTMWGQLGRPRRSAEMDEVFPDSASFYTNVQPEKLPMTTRVLATHIREVSSARWTPDLCTTWAAGLVAFGASLDALLVAHQPNEEAEMIARTTRRTAGRNGHAKLRA